jgi:hypothetical protein
MLLFDNPARIPTPGVSSDGFSQARLLNSACPVPILLFLCHIRNDFSGCLWTVPGLDQPWHFGRIGVYSAVS